MSEATTPATTSGRMLIYRDGAFRLQVRLDGQTVWLPQGGMAELYHTTSQNINSHIKSIYDEGELDRAATCKQYLQVRLEGGRRVQRSLKHYSLDVILAVGYRVRSARGTLFRQWATARLRELLVKGFVLDDERIKAGRTIGQDYFDELLERIRDIRATWKNAPQGPIRKADVTVAKNYLTESELRELNRIVGMYLDYAEDQAHRKAPMHMADWAAKLDAFLQFNERNILTHAGRVSQELAQEHAHAQFAKYDEHRRRVEAIQPTSDFDQAVTRVKRLEGRSSPDKSTRKQRRKKNRGEGA